jgi:hypothetical protein
LIRSGALGQTALSGRHNPVSFDIDIGVAADDQKRGVRAGRSPGRQIACGTGHLPPGTTFTFKTKLECIPIFLKLPAFDLSEQRLSKQRANIRKGTGGHVTKTLDPAVGLSPLLSGRH